MASSHILKVLFVREGKVWEIYARNVSHGSLFGFLEVEDFVFGTRSSVVVDPSEERVRSEFEGVKRTWLPLHSVLRVDEVKKGGPSKITASAGAAACSDARDVWKMDALDAMDFMAADSCVPVGRHCLCGHANLCSTLYLW